jgi:hypothetical protein
MIYAIPVPSPDLINFVPPMRLAFKRKYPIRSIYNLPADILKYESSGLLCLCLRQILLYMYHAVFKQCDVYRDSE